MQVSIIVAPLRNVKASSKVIDCVAKLLSLPLIIDCSPKDLADIRNVSHHKLNNKSY